MTYKYITSRTSPNQNNRNQSIKGITIHWWGDPVGQKIEGIVDWLCSKKSGVSAHYVVTDGIVYCIVDPEKRAWHAGNTVANHTQIGIELDPNASKRAGTMKTAAELIANLRKTYGDLPLSPHRKWTDTDCPGNYDLPLLDRMARGTASTVNKPTTSSAPQAKPTTTASTGVYKVTASVLNIRNGAGTNYKVVGKLPKGDVNTVLEVKNGFGKLKSGAGWVSMDYMQKVSSAPAAPKAAPAKPASDVYKVTAKSGLNVRTGPGENYKRVTGVKFGEAFTIVDQKNGFGKLKSGAGWVSMKYMSRV